MRSGRGLDDLLADYARWRSLPAMFFELAGQLGDKPFLWAKAAGQYRPLTWRETAQRVAAAAAGLRANGVGRGDRVALIAENRPEWAIADLAVMTIGAVTVPGYTTNTVEDHLHLLTDSGAKAVIVSTPALAERVLPAAARAAATTLVIAIEPRPIHQQSDVILLSWAALLSAGEAEAGIVRKQIADLGRDHTACIIYTSGTGGLPKGVMLSHGAILCNCMGACDLLFELGLDDEVFLCFLPLSHAYEHSAGQFFPMSIGAQIYYAESMETLARNMTEVRPTIMTAVPRLYEVLHGRVLQGVKRTKPLQQKLFWSAVALGQRRYESPGSLSLAERIVDRLMDLLVRRKVRARFGGRIKALVSGGAPLNVEVGTFFTALGLLLLQGYGQTEAAPIVSCNRPRKVKIHTVGPPLRGVTVRTADDGEIMVRGELVMQGYWNNPSATAAVLKDDWLATGDVGRIDEDGYIQITDRKKDIIVLSGGDTLSPQRVEGFLTLRPEIAQAMVFGDRRPYLVGLIVPDPDFVAEWASANGRQCELAALCEQDEFRKSIGAVVERVNQILSPSERVRRFTVAPHGFNVENNMMTASLKIRRHVIKERFGADLEALY